MSVLAKFTSIVGGVMVLLRRGQTPAQQAFGATPSIPPAREQGIMTLKMPSAKGWEPGHKPVAAPGLQVNAYAMGLDHPRWLHVLDNGDVLVAESSNKARKPRSFMDHAQVATMRRAGALGESANRITRLSDPAGTGTASDSRVFLQDLNQPFGMAVVGDRFFVGNTDGVVAFAFDASTQQAVGAGAKLVDFKPGGHWTRSLLASQDGRKLYAGVGSLSNIGDQGMEAEEGRAAVWELDLDTGAARIFAGGLRNAVGLAWEPTTGALWTVVNERDGLGDETPPDYLTSVQDGGFYGWPYSYWDKIVDDRVPQDAGLVARSITPDYALGGHTASLGLCWMPAGTLPGLPDGMVIGQHGSWNRAKLSGYKVVFVPFENGRPSGPSVDLLSGFLSDDEKQSYGRPVGVVVGPDQRSILVADDVGNAIWRISAA
ncbi:PQQ-dependent sugar dehydrogenase [Ketogulonicigenium vulgare]|uniref:PQQ-dependent sugar dehydrogenase n=1 Tax=Ketogulonicigenium vulgare TaxID=92945 RepID=UPI002358A777|nr:sorbosone dehydrogenase family protein [Ketogulonicigenium vulgare]